jgi:hypothetical protein
LLHLPDEAGQLAVSEPLKASQLGTVVAHALGTLELVEDGNGDGDGDRDGDGGWVDESVEKSAEE